MLTIRSPRLYDLPGIYRVCRLTGPPEPTDAEDRKNPDLLGHVYAGPYFAADPSLSWVVCDTEGVAGYLLACADTHAFESWCEQHWWPTLRAQYPLGSVAPADERIVELVHRPPRSPDAVVEQYPAHLHIDLLPRAIGTGVGRRLIEALIERLASRGVPGVHLGVSEENTHAIGFYEHLGFARLDLGPGLWMARSTT